LISGLVEELSGRGGIQFFFSFERAIREMIQRLSAVKSLVVESKAAYNFVGGRKYPVQSGGGVSFPEVSRRTPLRSSLEIDKVVSVRNLTRT